MASNGQCSCDFFINLSFYVDTFVFLLHHKGPALWIMGRELAVRSKL